MACPFHSTLQAARRALPVCRVAAALAVLMTGAVAGAQQPAPAQTPPPPAQSPAVSDGAPGAVPQTPDTQGRTDTPLDDPQADETPAPTAPDATTGDSPDRPAPTVDARLAGRVEQLVRRLVDDRWPVRHQAQQELMDLPLQAMPLLSEHYRRSADAELQWRIEAYAHQVFRERILPRYIPAHDKPGFLGVTHSPTTYQNRPAILVARLIPASPAARAGLRSGDIIIAVAGQSISPVDPSGHFGRTIQGHRPGQQLPLKIVRAGKVIELTVTLGEYPTTPTQYTHPMQDPRRLAQLEKIWWEQAFLRGQVDLPQATVEQFRREAERQPLPTSGTVIRQIVHPDGSVTIIQRLPNGQLQVISR